MKKIEWVVVTSLIAVGLSCLTVSATTMWGAVTIESYLTTFLKLCLWMGLPILVVGIIYFILIKKRKK